MPDIIAADPALGTVDLDPNVLRNVLTVIEIISSSVLISLDVCLIIYSRILFCGSNSSISFKPNLSITNFTLSRSCIINKSSFLIY